MRRLIKVLPNGITVMRIILVFIFLYCILQEQRGQMYSIIVLLAICISDLMDGKLARKFKVTSKLGAKLDVSADLLYIVTAYSTLVILGLLPLWFLIFIIMKFLEFVSTSKLIRKFDKVSKHPFVFDRVGRIVSAIFFIIPGVICFVHCFNINNLGYIISGILYAILIAGLYSSYTRIKSCIILMNSRQAQEEI